MKNKLHIYAQHTQHDHSFIVGDRESLELLRDAIDSALAEDRGRVESYTSDGEGFTLEIYREEDDAYWNNARLPYAPQGSHPNDTSLNPWYLFRKHNPK